MGVPTVKKMHVILLCKGGKNATILREIALRSYKIAEECIKQESVAIENCEH